MSASSALSSSILKVGLWVGWGVDVAVICAATTGEGVVVANIFVGETGLPQDEQKIAIVISPTQNLNLQPAIFSIEVLNRSS